MKLGIDYGEGSLRRSLEGLGLLFFLMVFGGILIAVPDHAVWLLRGLFVVVECVFAFYVVLMWRDVKTSPCFVWAHRGFVEIAISIVSVGVLCYQIIRATQGGAIVDAILASIFAVIFVWHEWLLIRAGVRSDA
ncbi:MAG: hypothetical protein GC159_13480 [Phycisphaera sp.]|nr:hypothetical protein [Phycisphaera sp.]